MVDNKESWQDEPAPCEGTIRFIGIHWANLNTKKKRLFSRQAEHDFRTQYTKISHIINCHQKIDEAFLSLDEPDLKEETPLVVTWFDSDFLA